MIQGPDGGKRKAPEFGKKVKKIVPEWVQVYKDIERENTSLRSCHRGPEGSVDEMPVNPVDVHWLKVYVCCLKITGVLRME